MNASLWNGEGDTISPSSHEHRYKLGTAALLLCDENGGRTVYLLVCMRVCVGGGEWAV